MITFIRHSAAQRKHWLLEDNITVNDAEGGFINRHGPFQSSLNEGKNKRTKKAGLFRGFGHMFRFGKHRKDGIVSAGDIGDMNTTQSQSAHQHATSTSPTNAVHSKDMIGPKGSNLHALSESRQRNGPPNYQPPPPVALGVPVATTGGSAIQHGDLFNHRYSHYVNYEELQQQIRYERDHHY